jgi:hypothetical protein
MHAGKGTPKMQTALVQVVNKGCHSHDRNLASPINKM